MLVAGVWCYSSVFAIGPLSGWGEYGAEPYGTACCINWHAPSTSSAAMSYIVCLFFFCYIIPCTVIFLSYTFILVTVRGSRQAVQQHVAPQNKIANAHTLIVKVTGLTGHGHVKECMFACLIYVICCCLLRCRWPFASASSPHGVPMPSCPCGQRLVTQQRFPPWLLPLQLSLPSPPPFTTPSSTWSSSPTSVSSCAGTWPAAEGPWVDVCANEAQPRRRPASRSATPPGFQTGSRRVTGSVDTVLTLRQCLGPGTSVATTARSRLWGYLKDRCSRRWRSVGCPTSYRATSCKPSPATESDVWRKCRKVTCCGKGKKGTSQKLVKIVWMKK